MWFLQMFQDLLDEIGGAVPTPLKDLLNQVLQAVSDLFGGMNP